MVETTGSTSIDLSAPWRLSHVLEGHTDDVKALAWLERDDTLPHVEVMQSASRDEQVRTWIRGPPYLRRSGNVPPRAWGTGPVLQGHRYQNSVALLALGTNGRHDDEDDPSLYMTIMGGLDSQIRVFICAEGNNTAPTEPTQILSDHHDNVCHLSLSGLNRETPESPRLLISASWDTTSRIWSLHRDDKVGGTWKALHLLKGHQSAVWAAEVVSAKAGEERYLTASADLFVRYWHGETVTRVFAGHTDVVRGIALLPPRSSPEEGEEPHSRAENAETVATSSSPSSYYNYEELFVTCSNDGSLRIWSLDERRKPPGIPTSGGAPLRVYIPKEEGGSPLIDLVYDVSYAGTDEQHHQRLLFSCGEGGKIHLWNIDSKTTPHVTHIPQPVTSAWSVLFLPYSGDVATADSDAKVRVYTQRRYNSALMAQECRLQQRACGSMAEWDKDMLAEHERKCEQVALARRQQVRAEIVEHEGDNTSSGQSAQSEHVGKRYDAVLKIDVSDDAEPLSLPLNKGDDPRAVAKAFIAQHSLPTNYEDDIVAFIQQVGPK